MTKLSAPAKSGYKATYDTISEARHEAAGLINTTVEDMIEVTSPDGDTTYCYATQEEADADRDGAYAVQYSEVAE